MSVSDCRNTGIKSNFGCQLVNSGLIWHAPNRESTQVYRAQNRILWQRTRTDGLRDSIEERPHLILQRIRASGALNQV